MNTAEREAAARGMPLPNLWVSASVVYGVREHPEGNAAIVLHSRL